MWQCTRAGGSSAPSLSRAHVWHGLAPLNLVVLQIVEKIKLQLQTFLDVEDDMWRAIALAMAKMFTNCIATADPVFRNQCMLGCTSPPMLLMFFSLTNIGLLMAKHIISHRYYQLTYLITFLYVMSITLASTCAKMPSTPTLTHRPPYQSPAPAVILPRLGTIAERLANEERETRESILICQQLLSAYKAATVVCMY